MTKKTPERGEVWIVDLGLARKIRPALIIACDFGDADRALITVVPHTTAIRGSAYEIVLPVSFLKKGAFLVQGVTSVPLACAVRVVGSVAPAHLEAVEVGLRSWLNL